LLSPALSRLIPIAVQQGECAGDGLYRFALNIGTNPREGQMFDVSKRIPNASDDDETDQLVGGTMLGQLAGPEGQRIYLPRGSAQSRFEPRSYYYQASDSGVVPKWVADEAWRKRGRRRIN
jgi:hypothetical protein